MTRAQLVWDMSDDESLWYGLARTDGRTVWFVRGLQGFTLYRLQTGELEALQAHKADREFFLGTRSSYDLPPHERSGRPLSLIRPYYAGRNRYPQADWFARSDRLLTVGAQLVDPFTDAAPPVLPALKSAADTLRS